MNNNIVVFCENNKVKVKIERITPDEEVNKNINPFNPFKEFFAGVSLPSISFLAQDTIGRRAKEKIYQRDAIIYELPTDPRSFFECVKILDDFSNRYCSDVAIQRNQSVDSFIQGGKLNQSIIASTLR